MLWYHRNQVKNGSVCVRQPICWVYIQQPCVYGLIATNSPRVARVEDIAASGAQISKHACDKKRNQNQIQPHNSSSKAYWGASALLSPMALWIHYPGTNISMRMHAWRIANLDAACLTSYCVSSMTMQTRKNYYMKRYNLVPNTAPLRANQAFRSPMLYVLFSTSAPSSTTAC